MAASPRHHAAAKRPGSHQSTAASRARNALYSPTLLRPTLETLGRFEHRFGVGLPDQITVHLDAGYDSTATRELLEELGCQAVISKKGTPLQAGARWVVERTNSWHNRGFKKLHVCTERRTLVIEAFIALANPEFRSRWSCGEPNCAGQGAVSAFGAGGGVCPRLGTARLGASSQVSVGLGR